MTNLSIEETRGMSMTKIEVELGKRSKMLEELGMEHKDVCNLVSSIMNLGIAAQEKWNSKTDRKLGTIEK